MTSGDTPADPRSDEELLLAVASGDQQAFSQLYDRVAPRVYGIVRRVLRDRAQSEEVTQEVLVELWRSASRFDAGRGKAGSWIAMLAHRRAIDRVRSEQAARDRDDRIGRRDRERPYDAVAEEIQTRVEHERVRAGLDHLTDLQREAIEMAYFGDHSYREVAEILGTPLGTVKTRVRDGLTRLRQAMDGGPAVSRA